VTAPLPLEYAGPVSRAIAYVLDTLAVAALFSVTMMAAGAIASVMGTQAHQLARAAAPAYLVLLPGVLAVYCMLFWALAGRTPGMAVLGLRVVGIRRGAVSWPAALTRAVVLAYLPIGAGWALVDRRNQGLHDKLARTVVVRLPSTGSTGRVAR
jgi:uncharacterized RDD family membrane protein YckC